MRFFCLLALASITLLAAGAGWAEQREAKLLRGPMSPLTERPIVVACTVGQSAACNDAGRPACNSICSNPKQRVGDCSNCLQDATAKCMAGCQ